MAQAQQVRQLIQHGDYAFSIDLQDAYLHIPIVVASSLFCTIFLAQCALSVEGFALHINFSKSDLCLTHTFCFLGIYWDTIYMSVPLPPDKLADIQQLALSLLQSQHVTVHRVMSFLG